MTLETEIRAPITNPKTGQEFLESTSFKVAQDESFTKPAMSSIFKMDYPAYRQYGRTEGAKPPPLSEMMHSDPKFFNEKASETVQSFEYRPMPNPVQTGAQTKLSATNFKMDRDLNKFNSFETVHNSYFTPKVPDSYKMKIAPTTRDSHIPQGDKEKELQPLSDYRERFKGHDTTVHKLIKAPAMHEGGPPTIKGDARQGHFLTTHTETFQGRTQPVVKTLSAPPSNNVPRGDPDKVVMRQTTMQASFQDVFNQNETPSYSTSEVSRVLNQTNFKQQDGHNKYNDYQSTAVASYRQNSIPVERFRPGKHRNHSDFPEGDMDPRRSTERGNMTTSRFYHGNPPRGLHNTIISGANIRTRSNVWFGEPTLSGTFYNTTNEHTFPAKTVPYSYNRASFYKSSDIPLDYYAKNEPKNTTNFSDYPNPRQAKTVPNPLIIDNLKRSHMFPPIADARYFSTTHTDTFTPKRADRYSYDAGRLQKSSVPLGTMSN